MGAPQAPPGRVSQFHVLEGKSGGMGGTHTGQLSVLGSNGGRREGIGYTKKNGYKK